MRLGAFCFRGFFGGHGIGHGITLSVLFHDPGHTKNLTRSLVLASGIGRHRTTLNNVSLVIHQLFEASTLRLVHLSPALRCSDKDGFTAQIKKALHVIAISMKLGNGNVKSSF
jgi:hypothetical protein